MGSLTPREIAESIVNARAERRDPEQILDWAVGALYLYCDEEARQKATEMALVTLRNGLPGHVPYAWNGAERYRQMGIAMSLFRIRQRIRAAQRLMQETVTWPENGVSAMQNGRENGG